MDKEIKNPKTGNKIKVRTALQLPGDHPANKIAKKLVAKSPATKDDVGGPAHPNVPKKKKGKSVSDKPKKDIGKTPQPSDFDGDMEKYLDALNQHMKDVESKLDKDDKPNPNSVETIVTKQNDKVAAQLNPNVSNGEELVMRGMADDIDEFMNEIPDEGQDFDKADELLNLIRDNEQGMRDDDDDVIDDYKKRILKVLNNPDIDKEKETGDNLKQMDKKESVKESKKRRYTVKEVRMWMKKLEENRYKKVYNSDARRVSWLCNHIGENLENMPKSMRKKWTKAQYGRERYLAKEFLKSQLASLKEQLKRQKKRKLNETWKPIAKKNVKYKDKTGTYNWEIESGIDTWAGDGNVPKIILHYTHEDEEGYPMSGGNTFWLKHKNGKPYTPQEAKKLVNKISNKKIHDFQRKSTKPSGSGQNIYYVDGKFIREGKLKEAYRSQSIFFDKKDKSKLEKLLKKHKGKFPFNPSGESVVNWSLNDKGSKGLEWSGIPKANYNKAVEFFMKHKLNPRG